MYIYLSPSLSLHHSLILSFSLWTYIYICSFSLELAPRNGRTHLHACTIDSLCTKMSFQCLTVSFFTVFEEPPSPCAYHLGLTRKRTPKDQKLHVHSVLIVLPWWPLSISILFSIYAESLETTYSSHIMIYFHASAKYIPTCAQKKYQQHSPSTLRMYFNLQPSAYLVCMEY